MSSSGPDDEQQPPQWQQPQWQQPQGDQPSWQQPQEPSWQQPQEQPSWQQSQPQWGQQQWQAAPQTPGSATAALILGICALLVCGPICGPLAVVYGNKAKGEIEASNGNLTGGGLATAGIIMGWIAIVLTVLAIIAIVAAIASS